MTEDLASADGASSAITAPAAAPETEKVETPAKVETTEAPTDQGNQPEPAKPTEDTDAKAASEAGKALNKHKQTASERVQQAVARQREAERESQRLRDRLAQLEGKIKAPIADEYTDPAKLNADQMRYTLDQHRVEDLKDQHAAVTQAAEQARAHAWAERVNDFKADAPDFEQVAFTAPIGRETSFMIADMEDGPAVAYHLGKNPAEARRIDAMPDREKAFALGRIAERITTKPLPKITSAPQPVTAVTGKSAGGSNNPPDNMNDYIAWRKRGGGQSRH